MSFSTKFVSQTGVGASASIKTSSPKDDFRALVHCYVTGDVEFDIEYTIDPASSPEYTALGSVGRTASCDDALYFPFVAIRVNVTSGTGTVKLVVMYKD